MSVWDDVDVSSYLFCVGTGMPGIFTLTAPRWFRLVKYRVFQSSPPKARFVVAGAPCTMRPSFFPVGSMIHSPPGAAAIDIALDVHLHAVGNAGLVAAQVGEDAVGLLRERAVGQQVEGPDVAAPRVVDVEHASHQARRRGRWARRSRR